jgi:hypothetical protein
MLNQTTKVFRRTVENHPVIEGPFHKQPSDFAILMAIIAVIAFVVVVLDVFIWRP